MTSYRAQLDLASALSMPQRCPGCAEQGLEPVNDGAQICFNCPSCQRLWHLELGWVSEVEQPPRRAPSGGGSSCASD